MHRTIVVGSARENGRCAHLAQDIFETCVDEFPYDGVSIVSVSSLHVAPCNGCDACRLKVQSDTAMAMPEDGDPLFPVDEVTQSDSQSHICKINDDLHEVRKHIDAADELIVVCPLYFAGAPAQMKALLDRMQPYYWSNIRNSVTRRNMEVHVIGEEGNPYGFDALITTLESAFGVCGFSLSSIFDWRGQISTQGEILGEPQEYYIAQEPFELAESVACEADIIRDNIGPDYNDKAELISVRNKSQNKPNKPKLSLSGNSSNKKIAANGSKAGSSTSGGQKKQQRSRTTNSKTSPAKKRK
jgi:multimeric flavodoxin WrbA